MRFFDDLLGVNRNYYTDKQGNKIEISDSGDGKVLRFNGVVYSRLYKNSIYTNEYWDYFLPLPSIWEKPRVLMIGLGGGTIAYQFDKLFGGKVDLEIVEVNEAMVEATKKFLPESLNLKIVLGDGLEYVKKNKDRYDLIILDAYIDSLVPKQFLGYDFINAAYDALSPSGILALNYINSSNGSDNLERYLAEMKPKFTVYTLSTLGFTMNTIIVCSKLLRREEILAKIHSGIKRDRENKHVFIGYEQMFQI